MVIYPFIQDKHKIGIYSNTQVLFQITVYSQRQRKIIYRIFLFLVGDSLVPFQILQGSSALRWKLNGQNNSVLDLALFICIKSAAIASQPSFLEKKTDLQILKNYRVADILRKALFLTFFLKSQNLNLILIKRHDFLY